MELHFLRRAAALAFAGIVAVLPTQRADADLIVRPGYDLFQSVTGTTFGGVPFQGVPLGNFDFGGTIGVKNVDGTDTIIQRLAQATAPSTTIPIQMLALHLMSVVPSNFGGGLDFYFITLQSERGGPASTGMMTINFGPDQTSQNTPPTAGTFDSAINVAFDVRKGALNGPIFLSDTLLLTSAGAPWSHFPPNGALELSGVNTLLDGRDRLQDFFPVPPLDETFPTGARLRFQETGFQPAVPEPSALFSGSLGALLGIAFILRSRRR